MWTRPAVVRYDAPMHQSHGERLVTALLCSLIAAPLLLGAGPSGMVLDPTGAPLAEARVVLETALADPLLATSTDAGGRFAFPEVDAAAFSIVAFAPGAAYAGIHFQEAPAAGQSITLRLGAPEVLRGRVRDADGKPVTGARIVRAAILGDNPVAVPLAKLAPFGVETSASDSEGRFEIAGLPAGAQAALKVAHPQYAQEGTEAVPVGGNIEVTMAPGTLVRGRALRRDDGAPAPNARVTLRSAHPPHDTTLVMADEAGAFLARLKPGHYLYRAETPDLSSVGWEPFTASVAEARLDVYLGPLGGLRGVVRDADSGEPIAGARVVAQTDKTVEAYLRTGADGTFALEAADGEYVVAVTGAPGYFPPASGATRVRLVAGETLDLPGQWLAPIPPFRVQFVDDAGAAVPGVLVSLLRPAQFGWTRADADGWATLRVGSLPEDGRILGVAEDPARPLGAFFTLGRETGPEARVQMLPLGSVSGEVRNARGRPLAGATIAAYFPGDDDDLAAPLWRTVADGEGAYGWDAVIPGVPLRCLVQFGDAEAQSETFSLNAGERRAVASVRVETTARGTARAGDAPDWKSHRLLCGPATEGAPPTGPAWVVYASPTEAPAAQAAAAQAREFFGAGLRTVVVVEGSHSCQDSPVPLYSGRRPGAASSYLLDATGRVVLASFGLPPARAVAKLLDANR